MPKFPDISALEYCQSKGLRILASEAFRFFYEELDRTPGNYLEIGTFEGYMLRELALMYPSKMFYGIDPFIEDGNTLGHNGGVSAGEFMHEQCTITHRNVEGIPNIKFFQETSFDWNNRHTIYQLLSLGITAVFIDGNHGYADATNDLVLATRLLSNGGVIYVDDAELPTVKKAIIHFGYKTEYRNGGAVIRI